MSLFVYGVMAVSAFVAVIWRPKMAEVLAMESAPIGAAFTLIALITGSLWGKPMWGTYWTWDARLTSELVLFFIYLGIIGLYHAFDDPRQGARAASFLAMIGAVNLPIVHYSVVWWNTLHQGTTVHYFGPSSIAPSMLWPLLLMTIAAKFYYGASLMGRSRVALLSLERGKDWVADEVRGDAAHG
ncbi:heme exporter protein C/cytochrome C-type biogenesis protein [mine drainage metagenome]